MPGTQPTLAALTGATTKAKSATTATDNSKYFFGLNLCDILCLLVLSVFRLEGLACLDPTFILHAQSTQSDRDYISVNWQAAPPGKH